VSVRRCALALEKFLTDEGEGLPFEGGGLTSAVNRTLHVESSSTKDNMQQRATLTIYPLLATKRKILSSEVRSTRTCCARAAHLLRTCCARAARVLRTSSFGCFPATRVSLRLGVFGLHSGKRLRGIRPSLEFVKPLQVCACCASAARVLRAASKLPKTRSMSKCQKC
jgi:hypothetical protein